MKLVIKLTLILVLGISIILTADGYLSVRREIQFFESDARSDERYLAAGFAEAVSEVWSARGRDAALELIKRANRRDPGVQIRWEPLSVTSAPAAGPPGYRTEELTDDKVISTLDPGGVLTTYAPLLRPHVPPSFVAITESLHEERQYVATSVLRQITVGTIIAALFGVQAVLFGAWLVGRPVQSLVHLARRVGAGDLATRTNLAQRDELGDLAREMNTMCDRLAEAQQRVAAETSARLAALEQLRHADRLSTAGKLGAGIAHELGTPLNVIIGRAKLIATADIAAPEIAASARVVIEQGERMTAIIRQFLDFARRRAADKAPTDLRHVVRQTVALLAPLADKQRVALTLDEPATPTISEADASQLQQVLANLIMNAIQAMPKGGQVVLSLREARRRPPVEREGPEDDWWCVRVADQGHGIRAEHVPHIFEPFFTTKSVGQGTGLGLSVAYGIVHEHGGWIDIDTAIGAGTTFSVYLPRTCPVES